MFFFPSKIERELKQALKDGPELELRYKDSGNVTVSQLLKVTRDYITILGFPGQIKQKNLFIKILATGKSFQTEVVRQGKGPSGRIMFICSLPKKFLPGVDQDHRYIIYPNGHVKALINTNRGDRGLTLPIWDFGDRGLSILNKTDISFQVGTKLFQAIVKVADLDTVLMDMQIISVRDHQFDDEDTCQLLNCHFRSVPKRIGQLVAASKKNQRHLQKKL